MRIARALARAVLVSAVLASGVPASPALRSAAPAAAPPAAAVPAAAGPAADPAMPARIAPCTACHGEKGRATPEGYYPRIAGKPAGYLFNQLENFRAGRRHFAQMTYFTELQEPDYLLELAKFFAAEQLPYPPPLVPTVSAERLARGRQLVLEGDAALQIPACGACHGKTLLGVQPAVPGLLGLSPDYLQAQIGAWRTGTRAAQPPDCMAGIVKKLSAADVSAAAAWLAAQPVPTGAAPEPAFAAPPPLRCGSIEAARTASPARPPDTGKELDPELQRGRSLVMLGDCRGCHTARGGSEFAGGRAIATAFGTFFSPNITPDPRTGIGRWSAEDFWHALHEGYAPDGTLLYPSFPYTNYTKVSRADADAMFAYLRRVPPVQRANRAHELRFPYGFRPLLAAWRVLFFRPGVYRADPAHGAPWNRGAYLVQGLGHCSACHEARNALGAIRSRDNPSGGLVLDWYAPSLFNPREAGLQDWSLEQAFTLLAGGQVSGVPAGTTAGPMAEVVHDSLQYVQPPDLRAMILYLRSLPAPRMPGAARGAAPVSDAQYESGRTLYLKQCAKCHGESGEGHALEGPPLAGNRAVLMDSPVNPIRIVLFGGYAPGTQLNPRPFGMPPYYPSLSDEQIADVLTYVRSAWANDAYPVDAQQVADNRGSPLW